MARLALRGARLVKIFHVVTDIEQVRQTIQALATTGSTLLNLTGLIGFFIFLMSTLTMHLLGDCAGNGAELALKSRSNFFTFGDSILANIQLLTGEDWAPIMFMHMDESSCGWAAAPFLIGVLLLYTFVLMNLFTAIILQNFVVSEEDKLKNQQKAYWKGAEADNALTQRASLLNMKEQEYEALCEQIWQLQCFNTSDPNYASTQAALQQLHKQAHTLLQEVETERLRLQKMMNGESPPLDLILG